MTIYAVSLKFMSSVEEQEPDEPLRELAIHLVFADDEAQARAKGKEIGRSLETTYRNVSNNEVRVIFEGIVQVQDLIGNGLFDGMEVSYWLYTGNRVNIDDNWIDPPDL